MNSNRAFVQQTLRKQAGVSTNTSPFGMLVQDLCEVMSLPVQRTSPADQEMAVPDSDSMSLLSLPAQGHYFVWQGESVALLHDAAPQTGWLLLSCQLFSLEAFSTGQRRQICSELLMQNALRAEEMPVAALDAHRDNVELLLRLKLGVGRQNNCERCIELLDQLVRTVQLQRARLFPGVTSE